MNEVKIPFFKKVIMAIKDIEKYIEFAAAKFSYTLSYALKLAALFTCFLVAISVYNVSKDVHKVYNYIENQITFIEFNQDRLQIENKNNEPIIVQNSIVDKFIVDTTLDKQKQEEYVSDIKRVSSGILFLNDRVVIKPINSNSMVITYSYKEFSDKYNINKLDKDILLEQISGVNILKIYGLIFGLLFIYQYIVCLMNIFIYAILIGSLGYFTAIILRLRMRFLALCKMVVYSLTLPILLNILYALVNTFTGFEIQYFDLVYIAISYIYVVAAILILKADVIKKGRELEEIFREQERIREELERKKEEEERRKQEEKRKEKEKKKEEKEKEKEQGENEPQGDNA